MPWLVLSMYFLDWDPQGVREQTVQMRTSGGEVLDHRTLTGVGGAKQGLQAAIERCGKGRGWTSEPLDLEAPDALAQLTRRGSAPGGAEHPGGPPPRR